MTTGHTSLFDLKEEAERAAKAAKDAPPDDAAPELAARKKGYRLALRMSDEQRKRLWAVKRQLEEIDGVPVSLAYVIHWAVMKAYQSLYIPQQRRGEPKARGWGDVA